MIIETTLHLQKDIVNLLEKASEVTGISKSGMVVLLIKRVMKNHDAILCFNGRIRYQERSGKKTWRRLHSSLSIRDYEYCQDLRKLCKKSVSFLVNHAVTLYLHDIIESHFKNHDNTDNYQFLHYIITRNVIQGVICWEIYWGIPEEIIHNPPLPGVPA